MRGGATAPRFVVMITTPLVACEPYIAVADASFSTSTDSISDGFMAASGLVPAPIEEAPPIITPSITYKGPPDPKEDTPLICTETPPPGCPDICCTTIPATFPCNAWSKVTGLVLRISAPVT